MHYILRCPTFVLLRPFMRQDGYDEQKQRCHKYHCNTVVLLFFFLFNPPILFCYFLAIFFKEAWVKTTAATTTNKKTLQYQSLKPVSKPNFSLQNTTRGTAGRLNACLFSNLSSVRHLEYYIHYIPLGFSPGRGRSLALLNYFLKQSLDLELAVMNSLHQLYPQRPMGKTRI